MLDKRKQAVCIGNFYYCANVVPSGQWLLTFILSLAIMPSLKTLQKTCWANWITGGRVQAFWFPGTEKYPGSNKGDLKQQQLLYVSYTCWLDMKVSYWSKPFYVSIWASLFTCIMCITFDAHDVSVCHNVGGQVNALNRLENILPCKRLFCLIFIIAVKYGIIVVRETQRK